MSLGEALILLKRAVARRYGSSIKVRFVSHTDPTIKSEPWVRERPLPLIIVDGQVILKGTMSLRKVMKKLAELKIPDEGR